jgi:quinol monooxygenase YgiN
MPSYSAAVLASVFLAILGAGAMAQTPPTLPPGSQVPVGNSVVSYIEVAPGSEAKALAALKALKAASAKDAGFVSFLVLQRTTHPNHFALIETWKDNAAREAHLNQPHVKTARGALKAMEAAPYDERPHKDLAVGESKSAGREAIYAVTHVDFVPVFREQGEAMLQTLASEGRKMPGNLRFDVLTQASRPNHMTIVSVWNNQDAWKRSTAANPTKDFREALLPKSGSLYDERFYRVVN